ncbi:MAG: cyclic nucleotide-binding domain-containing protein [Pseudomonadota bacterium]
MAISALAQHFLRQEIFQGLKPLQITEIIRRAERIVYRPGEMIIEEDSPADAAILLVGGEAVRIVGSDLRPRAEPIQTGSLLTELAMLIETDHSATVVAKTPVRALRIPRHELNEQMAADPAVADHFVARLTARLAAIAAELRAIDGVLTSPGTADSRGHAQRLPLH